MDLAAVRRLAAAVVLAAVTDATGRRPTAKGTLRRVSVPEMDRAAFLWVWRQIIKRLTNCFSDCSDGRLPEFYRPLRVKGQGI